MGKGLLGALLVLGAAAPASAAELVEIRTPSRWVDETQVTYAGDDHPHELRAKVLLPDGYDGRRRFPVLYLLHGIGENYRTWSEAGGTAGPGEFEGDIVRTAAALPAIVVMPEGSDGWYTNWWNGGQRGNPLWERFFLDELVPLIERRFAVRRGRRWRAVAGFSMGGFGAFRLASARPELFGAAVSISGSLSLRGRMPDLPDSPLLEFNYDEAFGPRNGFYREGHDPVALVRNLRHTRLYLTAGDGTPKPGDPATPVDHGVGFAFEKYVRAGNEEWVAAANATRIDHTWVPDEGRHSYYYAREDLKDAFAWRLFRRVPRAPKRWSYTTVARKGRMWGLRFRFDEKPSQVSTFERTRSRLTATGSGYVLISKGGRCKIRAQLPFQTRLGRRCL